MKWTASVLLRPAGSVCSQEAGGIRTRFQMWCLIARLPPGLPRCVFDVEPSGSLTLKKVCWRALMFGGLFQSGSHERDIVEIGKTRLGGNLHANWAFRARLLKLWQICFAPSWCSASHQERGCNVFSEMTVRGVNMLIKEFLPPVAFSLTWLPSPLVCLRHRNCGRQRQKGRGL